MYLHIICSHLCFILAINRRESPLFTYVFCKPTLNIYVSHAPIQHLSRLHHWSCGDNVNSAYVLLYVISTMAMWANFYEFIIKLPFYYKYSYAGYNKPVKLFNALFISITIAIFPPQKISHICAMSREYEHEFNIFLIWILRYDFSSTDSVNILRRQLNSF